MCGTIPLILVFCAFVSVSQGIQISIFKMEQPAPPPPPPKFPYNLPLVRSTTVALNNSYIKLRKGCSVITAYLIFKPLEYFVNFAMWFQEKAINIAEYVLIVKPLDTFMIIVYSLYMVASFLCYWILFRIKKDNEVYNLAIKTLHQELKVSEELAGMEVEQMDLGDVMSEQNIAIFSLDNQLDEIHCDLECAESRVENIERSFHSKLETEGTRLLVREIQRRKEKSTSHVDETGDKSSEDDLRSFLFAN